MHIEQRALNDIIPYDNNPRQNDDAVEAVARSIQEFGFRQPLVIDENNVIICGHTRYKAAKQLNLPMVNSWLSSPIANKTTNVFADFESAGHMAAKHLMARGIRKLGFIELEGDVLGRTCGPASSLCDFGRRNL